MRTEHANPEVRAEGRRPRTRDTWRDVGQGLLGGLGMLVNLATPFLRPQRSHWGLDEAAAARSYPGDDLVLSPRWSWTHGIEIDTPPDAVWPWLAQLGQERAGFYSYQWLENLAGCDIQNADRIHSQWQDVRVNQPFRLHPRMPAMRVAAVAPGRWFVVEGGEDFRRRARAEPVERAAHVSWLFYVEPLSEGRCRLVSRFRSDFSDDLASHLMYGPWVTESVGFMMDRRMLLGIKERSET